MPVHQGMPIDPAIPHGEAHWNGAAWLAEATSWLDDRLGEAGRARTDRPELMRVRRWSALVRAATDGGRVWLKAMRPECAIEMGVYALIERSGAGATPGLIATDARRGMLLIEDGGSALDERDDPEAMLRGMEAALPRYAELQRALAPGAEDLIGAPEDDLRPHALPARLDDIAATVLAELGDDGAATPVRRARERVDELAAWARELEASPLGVTVDHGDLTPANVLAADGETRIIDWGDASIAHPFTGLGTSLGWLAGEVLGCAHDDPRIERLRDAYLEAWSDLDSVTELRALAGLTERLAPISRAVTVHRAVRPQRDEGPPERRWTEFCARTLGHLGGT